jgi:subtilisin
MNTTRELTGDPVTKRGRSTTPDGVFGTLVARFKRFAETPEEYILFAPRPEAERAAPDEYVISAPTGYRAAAGTFRLALRDLHNRGGVDILDELHETGEKLARMNDEQLRQLRATYPQLVIEPNQNYKLLRHPGLDDLSEPFFSASGATQQITITVAAADGTPISDAKVYVVLDFTNRVGHVLQTDSAGTCSVHTKPTQIEFISAVARSGYWSGLLDHPSPGTAYKFTLDPLKPTIYGWGHTAANMRAGLPDGSGVTIGVIDTGIRSDHPDLTPTGGLNCIRGENPAAWDDDDDGHGTHCAGVIAGRGYTVGGYVPSATIRSYRVFPKGKDAPLYAIAKGLQAAIDDGCDIISMSFGRPNAQDTIRSKIEQAYDKGILCIAAAGNDRTSVYYPAAFYPVVAVSAFGEVGTYPTTSAHRRAETTPTGRYVAEFSNFGPEIAVIAPGVAVVSTVPDGYAAWDGTSMAAPHVTGMAALTLARNPAVLSAARNGDRVDQLLKLLLADAKLLGVGTDREGSGFPQMP